MYLSRCGTLETTSFGFATVLRSNLMEAAGQAARTGVASKGRGGGGGRAEALQIVTHFQTRTVSARPSPVEARFFHQRLRWRVRVQTSPHKTHRRAKAHIAGLVRVRQRTALCRGGARALPQVRGARLPLPSSTSPAAPYPIYPPAKKTQASYQHLTRFRDGLPALTRAGPGWKTGRLPCGGPRAPRRCQDND